MKTTRGERANLRMRIVNQGLKLFAREELVGLLDDADEAEAIVRELAESTPREAVCAPDGRAIGVQCAMCKSAAGSGWEAIQHRDWCPWLRAVKLCAK